MSLEHATAAERAHMAAVKALGCLICRKMGMGHTCAHAHHLIESGLRVGHFATIPLCEFHHVGADGIHKIHAVGFERKFKVTPLKLLAQTYELLDKR